MRTVGLTGGIACGKSTVADLLRARGVPVLDLDKVARDVVAPGEPALAEIAARWPSVIVDGTLDRRALGAVIVADPAAKRALEAITHPRIWERTERWLAEQARAGAPVAVVEAALMVETGSHTRYDTLLVVSCSPEVQRARLAAREGYDDATVARWLAAQMPLAAKEAVAQELGGVVIHNDTSTDVLAERLTEAWARILSNA
ncbi:MAG: dephospho-CoA kinase [Pseudomonadota bacterium]|nr:dephospho-CoA kinase [Pseudomonadota bacterium]